MPVENNDELEQEIFKILDKEAMEYGVHSTDSKFTLFKMNASIKVRKLITADRERVALEARIEPFDFVESCEPDCDDVRHAYHQGQWDMATRIKAQQEEV